jgi:hypothetical protein
MKFTLALVLLTAFAGYAHAGNLYVPRANQYVPRPTPGPGPCIQCGGMQLKNNHDTVINPTQKYTPTLGNTVISR